MGKRFPVSGSNATAILQGTVSSAQQVYGVTSGKVFWLRGLSLGVDATLAQKIDLVDATVAGTATTPVISIPLAWDQTALATGAVLANRVFNFGPPGIKFSTNCCARMSATVTLAIGGVTVWGYEE